MSQQYKEQNVHRKQVQRGFVEPKPVAGKSQTKRVYDWLVVSLDYPICAWLATPLQRERAWAKPARFKVLNECRTEQAAMRSRSSRYECEWIYGRTFIVHRVIFNAHYKGKEIG